MPRSINATASSGALTIQAFVGDGCTLLAFDLREGATDNFAGFSIKRTEPGGSSGYILNMLSFADKLTQKSSDSAVTNAATSSDKAPFQKYRWIDFPSNVNSGTFTYTVETRYFDPDESHLKVVDSAEVAVTLGSRQGTDFHVGFTRGYVSSQAYAREFPQLEFRPADRSEYLFDSAPYEKQWAWLGYHAREMLFDFLTYAQTAAVAEVDAFIYDVDEPNFVRDLIAIGHAKKLRVILDDSTEGGKVKPDRADCAAALEPVIGAGNILRTHFKRFAHDKVLIAKDASGKAVRVLCGSANFSIRGLYVQGNSIIVIDDPDVAQLYASAFETAWASPATFASQPIAKTWTKFKDKTNLPAFAVSFAPHTSGEFALTAVENAIKRATQNVIFALMSDGGGNAIADLKKLATNKNIFTFGVTQTQGLATEMIQGGATKMGVAENEISSFVPLDKMVPEPFRAEFSGGQGQVIHHKFVVVDFNGPQPTVFCGSSNLSSGGEQQNGDNLLGIYDREIATLYAIEGIRLADHYRFRDKLQTATDTKPMTLQGPNVASGEARWYADFYTPGTAKYRSRLTLIQ